MFSCNYTNGTSYTFRNELCDLCEDANYVGVCTDRDMKSALRCGTIEDKWVQLFISKVLDVPTQKPDMEGICTVNTCVNIISQRVVKTPTVTGYTNSSGVYIPGNEIANAECTHLTGRKLIVEGIIQQKVIYTAHVPDQALHSTTFKIPFSAFIIVDSDTALSQKYQISTIVEDVFACALSERSIFSNNTIFIKAVPVC